MNERIIELANKANEDVGYTFKLEDAKQIHKLMEKFAELIVAECIAQCEKNVDHEYLGWGSKLSAFNIKQHFGVEE